MTGSAVTKSPGGWLRDGARQGFAALAVAACTVAIIAVTNGANDEVAVRLAVVRLAIAGMVFFVLALAVGSSRAIGAASLPVLGSALLSSATSDGTAWVPSIVVGCLWFVAVELAWESVERRDLAQRSAAIGLRRINEVATVVVVSLAVSTSAYAASSLGVARTLTRQACIVVTLLLVVGFAIHRIVATAPPTSER